MNRHEFEAAQRASAERFGHDMLDTRLFSIHDDKKGVADLDANGFPLRTAAELAQPPMPEKTPDELAAFWTKYVRAFEAQWRAGAYWTALDAIKIDKLRERYGIQLSADFEQSLRKKLYWLYGEKPEQERPWVNGDKPLPESPEPYEQHAMGYEEQ